jgi:hypothetical protein
MLSKNHPIILFIDRFGFSIYQDTLTNIPKFSFTPDLVTNLDVVNKEQLTSLIATFIQINKMIGSCLAVILSDNVIYARDLKSSVQKSAPAQSLKTDLNEDKERKNEVQNFLEDIPFEDVLAKVIKVGSLSRVVATNKDLVMVIVNAFVSKGSTVEAIIPSFMYGQSANFTGGLTPDNIRVVLGNAEIMKSGNLLTGQEQIETCRNVESEFKTPQSREVKKPNRLRQYALIGILGVLLIVLVFVYLANSQPPAPKTYTKNNSENTIIPTVAPVGDVISPTSVQTSVTPALVDLKSVKIKITQSSEIDAKAIGLKNGLSKIGFTNIANEVSEIAIPERSSVIFSHDIPEDLRSNIIAEIEKIFPDVSVLENENIDSTVNISIGKS